MTTQLSPLARQKFFSNDGIPLVRGLLYTYQAGTNTPQVTYTDSTQTTQNTNPIVLDARGECSLWFDPTLTYKVKLTDSVGNTIPGYPVDNISGTLNPNSSLIPAVDNLYTLGSPSFAWAQLYLGANHEPALDTLSGIIGFYPTLGTETGVINNVYPVGNAWRYLNSSQLTDVQGMTFLVDCTTALQNWINSAYQSRVDAYLPGGGYLVSAQLILNQSDQTNYRNRAFRMYGCGGGPVFVVPGTSGVGTSVIQSNTDAPIIRYDQYLGTVTTSGNFYIQRMRLQQVNASATSAVMLLDVLGEYSVVEEVEIYQAGTGDGIRCLEMTKATIQYCNILNRDWATAGVGSSRVGTGINIFDQYNAGLGCIRKNTCRGFKDGIVVGYGSFDLGPFLIQDNECSVTYRGLTIGALMSKTLALHNYFEGTELTCITDQGRYTTLRDNELQPATWTLGIDGSANGGGCVYDGNYVGLSAALAGVTGINVAGSNSLFTTITNNSIVWGSSGTSLNNVIGLTVSGTDAMLEIHGNEYNPQAAWSGTGNTTQFQDLTTTGDGSAKSGIRGFGTGLDATTSFPRLQRGAVSYWINSTALANGSVSANVMTLGNASYYIVTFTSGQTVSAFSGVSSGQEFILHFTNSNATINNGANIKLAGSASFTSAASGSVIRFVVEKGVAIQVAAAVNF